MNYSETIRYLFNELPVFSKIGGAAYKKDLTNIKALCGALGNPQEKFKSIHVAGTNGKGSVCHMLSAIFQEAGYKTGLFTSPHLVDFRERIRVNGQLVSKEFVVDFVARTKELTERVKPSFFEVTTAMAFSWFAQEKVDIAIIEVGLGGRLDSTNIIVPELSVITNISLEHTKYLGNTRTLIAGEKAGIIKKEVPVVLGEKDEETEPVYLSKAAKERAAVYFAQEKYHSEKSEAKGDGQEVTVWFEETQKRDSFYLDLPGHYQLLNLQTVLTAVDILEEMRWELSMPDVKKALSNVKRMTGLRGRWEILKRNPTVIIDTGHNPGGMKEVSVQISRLHFEKLHVVLGFSNDKDVSHILPLFSPGWAYYFCRADNERALSTDSLKEKAAEFGLTGAGYSSVKEAYLTACTKAHKEDIILITGSNFIIAELLEFLEGKEDQT